jgi:putative FmdB family regulatory protein
MKGLDGDHAMPRYEFRCESCGKGFEMTLTLTERANAEVNCPNCGSEKVIPQLTVFTARTSRKPLDEAQTKALAAGVERAVAALPPKEAQVIRRRFGVSWRPRP